MGCVMSSNFPTVEINFGEPFGNVEPTESDSKKIYSEVSDVLKQKDAVFQRIEDYKGCQELARAAMSKPSEETEMAAFTGLLVAVESIAAFHDFSKALGQVFPKLLVELAGNVKNPPIALLGETPGLTAQLATIFEFTSSFDRVRMLRPNLSNDFSYYRRLLPKFNKHPDIKVKDDDASGMALFTADHIPMTLTLAKAGFEAQDQMGREEAKASESKIGDVLATMANSALMVLKSENNNLSSEEALKIARTMTGAAVIFDHIDPLGAFKE